MHNHIISHISQNLSKWLKIFSRYSLRVTIRRDLFISCELLWLNCSIYQTGLFKFSGSVVLSTHIINLKLTSLVWALSHMWNLLLCALCEKMWLIHIKKSTFDLWEQKPLSWPTMTLLTLSCILRPMDFHIYERTTFFHKTVFDIFFLYNFQQ